MNLISMEFDLSTKIKVLGELEILYEKPVSFPVGYMLYKQDMNLVLGLKHTRSVDKIKFYKDGTLEERTLVLELLDKAWNLKPSELSAIKLKAEIAVITKVMGDGFFRDVNLLKSAEVLKTLNKKITSITFQLKDLLIKREASAVYKDFEMVNLYPRVLVVLGIIDSSEADKALKILQSSNSGSNIGNKHILVAFEKILGEFLIDRTDHTKGFVDYMDTKLFLYASKGQSDFEKSNPKGPNGNQNQNQLQNQNQEQYYDRKGKGKFSKGKGKKGGWGKRRYEPYGPRGWDQQWGGGDAPSWWDQQPGWWGLPPGDDGKNSTPEGEKNAEEEKGSEPSKGKGSKGKGKYGKGKW